MVWDPRRTSYAELVRHFFASHDATAFKAKKQYASTIFVRSAAEREEAEAAVASNGPGTRTVVLDAAPFWAAEEKYQAYNAKLRAKEAAADGEPRDAGPPACACAAVAAPAVAVESTPESASVPPVKAPEPAAELPRAAASPEARANAVEPTAAVPVSEPLVTAPVLEPVAQPELPPGDVRPAEEVGGCCGWLWALFGRRKRHT